MPFAKINGITLDVRGDGFSKKIAPVGELLSRGVDGEMGETRVVNADHMSASIVCLKQDEGEAWSRFLQGFGHAWLFDAHLYSTKGVAASSGTHTYNAGGGKRGGRVNVSSGSSFTATLAEKMGIRGGWLPVSHGWTIICFKVLTAPDGGDGVTYFHHIATGNVAVVRGASANPAGVTQYRNGVAGNFSMGNWISVTAAGVVGIHGHSNASGSAAYDYDELIILPFALPSTWASALYTWHNATAWTRMPRLELSGDCVPAAKSVIGKVPSTGLKNVRLDGAHRNNAYELEVELYEV